jgi:hypothetical protein
LTSGNLAARTGGALVAGSEPKILWIVRVPHDGFQLRLAIERLDGPGVGRVVGINRTGGPSGLAAGWEQAVAYPSNLTFDTAGCWRIRDLDGTPADSIVIEVKPRS